VPSEYRERVVIGAVAHPAVGAVPQAA
jgi:hypothetical protein